MKKPSKKIILIAVAVLILTFIGWKLFWPKNEGVQYQTAKAEKGALIQTVTASGQITAANNVQITTQVTGVIKEVFVKNGDQVSQGQKIAALTLDQASQQKAAAAYASYLSAKNSLDSAMAKVNSLQSAEFKANQKFISDAVARNLAKDDPTYIQENADWLQAEADYKNQSSAITQTQAALQSASLALSQTSSTITAPVNGIIKGLTITSVSSASLVLGSVYQSGPILAQVAISEIDSVKVSEGQKVTLALDAFPNLSFTGKVISVNTNGLVSSGVTTYPAVISLDNQNDKIFPNMSVSANIITNVKNDVLLVPSGAVQNNVVRILKNNTPVNVTVEAGDSNDTQTEIKLGLSEGDEVIIGTSSKSSGQSGTSPFSTTGFGGTLRPGGFGGGGRR